MAKEWTIVSSNDEHAASQYLHVLNVVAHNLSTNSAWENGCTLAESSMASRYRQGCLAV